MKKPLLHRSVNTRTHGVCHGSYRAYRYERNTKKEKLAQSTRGSMHSHHRHGFDYTPLYRFLLSKVGQPWDPFSEKPAPAWTAPIQSSGWSRSTKATNRNT